MKFYDIIIYFFNLFRFKKNIQIEPETFVEFIGQDHEININNNFNLDISPIHNVTSFFNNQDEVCCVCLNSLDSKKTVKMSGCKHKIHIVCAKGWLYEKSECPLCREDQSKLKKRLKIN